MHSDLRIESTRGDLVESVHLVSLAVVDATGKLVAEAGNPHLVTCWRSAAKPFQAIPLIADGAADRFGFDQQELALACASHSSEPVHREVASGMLRKLDLSEGALACGPHPPLSPAMAEYAVRHGEAMTPRWSNCSGKHAGMLALALAHRWPTAGYERQGHPVQSRILQEIVQWTSLSPDAIRFGVDGCTAVSFGLPLDAMALAYARLSASDNLAAARLRSAMAAHPGLVAGEGRLCTDLMAASAGLVLAKVGADGIYCAALIRAGLGVALKIEDGDMRSAGVALLAALGELGRHIPFGWDREKWPERVTRHALLPTINTRGEITGQLRANGALRFLA